MTTTTEPPRTPSARHRLHEISGDGDTEITWNPDNPAEVAAARDMFRRLKGQGYLAYRTDSEPAEVIRDFDPDVAAMVMRPQIVGG